jgi:hypothetical protein
VVEVERLEGVVDVEKIESLDGMLIETENIVPGKESPCWSPVGTVKFSSCESRHFGFEVVLTCDASTEIYPSSTFSGFRSLKWSASLSFRRLI